MEKKRTKISANTRVSRDTKEWLKRHSAKKGMSSYLFIESLIEQERRAHP